MILVLDLDDTLYPEESYVYSGFHAVANYLEYLFGWDNADSFNIMKSVLEKEGRGSIFNLLLERKNVLSKSLVCQCVGVYRHHEPNISLFPSALRLLRRWNGHIYLVTDGHKVVQQKKIKALEIEPYFRKILITHRYGIQHAKPSIYCFERILNLERCNWSEIIYIGDNPMKDFVNLTPLGAHTVRVLTGEHRNVIPPPGFDASYTISNLDDFDSFI